MRKIAALVLAGLASTPAIQCLAQEAIDPELLSRAIRENGALELFEIEAVQGRRHFLLTVRARDGSDISYRISDASISFLGVGLAALQRP